MSEPTAIFSGGTGRSGTTIVAKLLRCHPQIRASRPLEVRCITDSAGLLDLCVGVRPNAPARMRLLAAYPPALMWEFERRMRGRWWRRTNRLGNASGLHRGIDEVQRDQLIRELRAMLRQDRLAAGRNFVVNLARAQGVVDERYWIDTSPPNAANADLLHTIVPDARFVHMVRDGRDTMASVLQESWGPDDPQAAAHWWAERVMAAHRALANVPKHLVRTVQLEAWWSQIVSGNTKASWNSWGFLIGGGCGRISPNTCRPNGADRGPGASGWRIREPWIRPIRRPPSSSWPPGSPPTSSAELDPNVTS